MKNYDGIVWEIVHHSEKTNDGRWVIPIEVDWDFTITKCSSWENNSMEVDEVALKVMREWQIKYNVGWILNTMRPNEMLVEPMRILRENNIDVYGVRANPIQGKGDVTKVFAIMSIDDRNLGVPHKWAEGCDRPHVDWEEVDKLGKPILEAIYEKLRNTK